MQAVVLPSATAAGLPVYPPNQTASKIAPILFCVWKGGRNLPLTLSSTNIKQAT
jgi:hypothetical protein